MSLFTSLYRVYGRSFNFLAGFMAFWELLGGFRLMVLRAKNISFDDVILKWSLISKALVWIIQELERMFSTASVLECGNKTNYVFFENFQSV